MGRDVTRFQPGDEVFGQSVGANLWGTAAPTPSTRPFAKPDSAEPADLTFEQAAAVLTSDPSRCKVSAMKDGFSRDRRF